MIIVQLKGGLGNQLFQYAAGLSLATHHGVEVLVDIAALGKQDEAIGTVRHFDLADLQEPPAVASPAQVAAMVRQSLFNRYCEKLLSPYKRKLYKEAAFSYDPNFFKAGSNIYLKGYRQSEKYFAPIKELIRERYVFKPSLYEHLKPVAATIKSNNGVSIHIRRGDYDNKSVDNYYAKPGTAYYNSAIELVGSKVSNRMFYVFTDNPAWVQQHLRLPANHQIVSGVITKTHLEDFYLMSQCNHNIIANSSFSWWAAWLNDNAGKIVIAPQKWFDQAKLDSSDLIPESWFQL